MFHRIGAAAYKKDLVNTLLLCKHLGQPQTKFKTIHVAGTNGKGSVSHILAAVLQQAGYKTGLYTSPHLYDFRERIKINGQPVTEEIHPSFFEVTVAMAFEYFAQQQIDIAVIETGLGGRLDSTNIITPELSIITNIGYDHVNLLGNTLEAIATEKAGIIKPNIPVVIGETLPETKPVFEQTATTNKSILFLAETYCDIQRTNSNDKNLCVQTTRNKEHKEYCCDLTGNYQVKNIRTVLCAIDVLQQQGIHINEKNIQQGLEKAASLTGLQGRWEKINSNPDMILDVAHNEDGIRQLLPVLDARKKNNIHIVMGMVKDKDANKVLALLPKYATYYFTQAHIPRAMEKEILKEMAAANGLHGAVFEDVNAAIKSAGEKAAPTDLILVIGSVFLVGEVNRDEVVK
jgi:dihydrofolate synthase / folylpolyglutamate synthase